MTHPLARLLGPLQYACHKDFAQLGKVRNLRALLEGALPEARGSAREQLARELPEIDQPDLARRKASLKRVIGALKQTGVELPPELARLAASTVHPELVEGSASPGSARSAGRPVQPGASTGSARTGEGSARTGEGSARTGEGAARAASRSARTEDSSPRAGKKPPATRTDSGRRKAKGQKESRSEARLLSIAPRSGPLATPLSSAGWRLPPRLVAALARKGLKRVGDVLFLLPRCYEDRRELKTISQLVPGERGVTVATVRHASDQPFHGRRRGFRAVLGDATGSLAVTFFQGGPWLKARFPVGKKLVVSGEVRASPAGREITHPEIEPAEDLESSSIHFGRIVPIYPGFERTEQRAFRELTQKVCAQYAGHLQEPLPEALRARLGLPGLVEALRSIHFPDPGADLEALDAHHSEMHRRLAFDELFFLQLGMALRRRGVKVEPGIAFDVSARVLDRARGALPFTLTRAQQRVVKELARDMGRAEPMNRLLQGDVGSGKTAVAAVASLIALQDGYQAAVMAPTELLASQHARTFDALLGPLGYHVALFTSGGTPKERRARHAALSAGEVHVAVGTHALIQEAVDFHKLGLVVIDEQHRFGVMQRHSLMNKGCRPDVLVMTATPIPRTLAMTLYGDLDVSVIDELPPGRTPIATRAFGEKQRARVYEAIARELEKGRQAYVVYPLVEESEKVDLADATKGAQEIQFAFPDRRVGLLHGKLADEEKAQVMEAFRQAELDILVCTTVIEVGVDVPNASVMVIEHAERFGLSQLHQLRGRVGRGAAESFCFLIASHPRSQDAAERLAVMEKSSDGFVIAEKDLELRGPGEFLGTRQSGIPELAVANLARDQDLLAQAQQEARQIVASDPALTSPENRRLIDALEERWEGRLSLARVG